jgi:hypothetical protein
VHLTSSQPDLTIFIRFWDTNVSGYRTRVKAIRMRGDPELLHRAGEHPIAAHAL